MTRFKNIAVDDQGLLASTASEIFRMRRTRDRNLPPGLVGEPAWDILLALFSENPGELTLSSACYCASVPPATASRWIDVLQSNGLVEKTKHPRDDHIVLVKLTSSGRTIMERCLKAMLLSTQR